MPADASKRRANDEQTIFRLCVCAGQRAKIARLAVFYDKKIADGKSPKEAMRALRRRISDNVFAHLRADLEPKPSPDANDNEQPVE